MLSQTIISHLGNLHFSLKCALKIVCHPSDINPILKYNVFKIPSPTAEQLVLRDILFHQRKCNISAS